MKICALSDLHGYLPKQEDIPPCDVVCIAGDISPLNIQRDKLLSAIWFGYTFIPWCESLNCMKVVFVAGNHDFFLEDYNRPGNPPIKFGKYKKVIYLNNSSYKFAHKKFYGTPHVEDLPNWAFNLSSSEAKKVFANIPDCNILISHTPPFDAANTGSIFGDSQLPDYGSCALAEALRDKSIDLIICGHVHSGNHELSEWKNHKIVNVSYLNEDYRPVYSPKLIEI